MMWLGMVQKGENLENKGGREDETRSFLIIIGRVGNTCSRKPQTLFWYNTNFKCFFGIFFNKTWDYVVNRIDVFSNTEKHRLLQWILCSTFVRIFCSIKLWWNELYFCFWSFFKNFFLQCILKCRFWLYAIIMNFMWEWTVVLSLLRLKT